MPFCYLTFFLFLCLVELYIYPVVIYETMAKIQLNAKLQIISFFLSRPKPTPGKLNYVIRKRQPKNITTTLAFHMLLKEHLTLFIMKPSELSQQSNIQLSAYLLPGKIPLQIENHPMEQDPHEIMKVTVNNSNLLQTFEDGSISVAFECNFTYASRYLDILNQGEEAPKVEPLTDKEKHFFLRSENRKYNFTDKRFQQWMINNDLFWNKEKEELIEFGNRILGIIHKNVYYSAELKYRGCGEGGVAQGIGKFILTFFVFINIIFQ